MEPTEWDRAYKQLRAIDEERQQEQDHELEAVAATLVWGIAFIVLLAAIFWVMF